MQLPIQLKGLALSDESLRQQFLQRKTPAGMGFTAVYGYTLLSAKKSTCGA